MEGARKEMKFLYNHRAHYYNYLSNLVWEQYGELESLALVLSLCSFPLM